MFSQGDVGSAEGPYLRDNPEVLPDGVVRAWAHVGHAQTERGARYLADSIVAAWNEIGRGEGLVPFSRDVPVRALTALVPGPGVAPVPERVELPHRADRRGHARARRSLGLPDCERSPESRAVAAHCGTSSRRSACRSPSTTTRRPSGAVEENARLKLQVVRLGEVLLASCACEPQMDLVRNLESRLDDVAGNIDDGYDWSSRCARRVGTSTCDLGGSRSPSDAALLACGRRCTTTPPGGTTPPTCSSPAPSRPTPPPSRATSPRRSCRRRSASALPIALGHTSDYNGYTVSYREYMARDHYRKALTSYGPHTADHINTHLVAHGRRAQGRARPPAVSLLDPLAAVDEARQAALADAIGQASSAPRSTRGRPRCPTTSDPPRPLDAAGRHHPLRRRDRSRGGAAAPPSTTRIVRVERRAGSRWVAYADQTGEVPTMVALPAGVRRARVDAWTGSPRVALDGVVRGVRRLPAHAWSPVARCRRAPTASSSTACTRAGGDDAPYHLESAPFRGARRGAASPPATPASSPAAP